MMTPEEQAELLRSIYRSLRKRLYSTGSRTRFALLTAKNKKFYCEEQERLYAVTNIIENALIADDFSRALKYLVLFKAEIDKVTQKMEKDCEPYI